MSNIIEIKNLTKSFTQGKEKLIILDKLDLQIKEGDIMSIVGESGCGKSTLLQIVGGLMDYDSGNVTVAGQDLKKCSSRARTTLRRNNIGFIYQQHHLLSDFNAMENIAIACRISGKGKQEAENNAMELLKKMGLEDRASHRPAELSGGQQQRVAIARAFANEPKVILADEPTGNLDEKNAKMVTDLFMDISRNMGTTLVIATHNKEISGKTDYICKISGGHANVV